MSGFHKKMKSSPASYDGSGAGTEAATSYVRRVIACIRGRCAKIGFIYLKLIVSHFTGTFLLPDT